MVCVCVCASWLFKDDQLFEVEENSSAMRKPHWPAADFTAPREVQTCASEVREASDHR